MPTEQDFLAFRESISKQLQIEKDRVRQLIGGRHWLTDGEHKESILRKVIREIAPESHRIGRGFVCYPHMGIASKQLDILIISKSLPVLYRDEDLFFVTPDAVKAIVEVKTQINCLAELTSVFGKLSDELENIRNTSTANIQCWGGLFIYEDSCFNHQNVLEALQRSAQNKLNRVINCVCIGSDMFVRFWPRGHSRSSPKRKPMWHSYYLERLSAPYFIGNIIFHITPEISNESQQAWFPISGTKESRKCYYAELDSITAKSFST